MDVLIKEGSQEFSFSLSTDGFTTLVDPTGKVGNLITIALLEGQNGWCSASNGSMSVLLKNIPPTILSITPLLNFSHNKTVAEYLQLTSLLESLSRSRGEERCSNCGGEIRDITTPLITDLLLHEFSFKLVAVTAATKELSLKELPFQRLVVDGKEVDLDDPDVDADAISPPYEVIIDRLKVSDSSLARLSGAIERGFKMSGAVRIYPYPVSSLPRVFAGGRSCIACGRRAAGELYLGKGSSLASLLQASIEDALVELRRFPSDPTVDFITGILSHCSSLNLNTLSLSTSLGDLSIEEHHLLALALLVQPGLGSVLYFIGDVLRHLHKDDIARVISFLERSNRVLATSARPLRGAVEVFEERRTFLPPNKRDRETTRQIECKGYVIEVPSLLGICGAAGTGKRALAKAIRDSHGNSFERVSEEWYVAGKAGRSFVAKYLKIWEPLTRLYTKLPFAVMRGVTAKELRPEHMGERVVVGYEDLRFRGLSLSDVLSLSIAEALEILKNHRECERPLSSALGLGLGHLSLGTPLDHLTQGELQRLRLFRRLSKPAQNELIIFDLPSNGLPDDEASLIGGKLSELVGEGSLVVVIDHNKVLLDWCDRVIKTASPSL